jgi:hypothetical protein
MASFSNSDKLSILEHLGYSTSNRVYLENQLNIAYLNFGDEIVLKVQEILEKLEEASELEETYANDANSALIKADVLEWDPNGRQGNLSKRKNSLLKKLSDLLGMPSKVGYQGTPLLKS